MFDQHCLFVYKYLFYRSALFVLDRMIKYEDLLSIYSTEHFLFDLSLIFNKKKNEKSFLSHGCYSNFKFLIIIQISNHLISLISKSSLSFISSKSFSLSLSQKAVCRTIRTLVLCKISKF